MELKIRKNSDIYIIDIYGEMDLYNAYQVKALYDKMTEKKISSIIVNFEEMSYIDSSGIGCLIYMHSKSKERHVKLNYSCFNGSPAKLIALTKLDKIFCISSSVEESVLSMK